MSRECKIRIQIEAGTIQEAISTWGFHLMESDDTVVAPIKDYEIETYPETAHVEINPYTTLKPFDYTCTLLCFGALTQINTIVKNFFDSLFVIDGTDLRKAKEITIYNDYKGVKVSGYVKSLEGQDYMPKLIEYEKGAYLFDFVIFVSNPKKLLPL